MFLSGLYGTEVIILVIITLEINHDIFQVLILYMCYLAIFIIMSLQ